MEGYLPSWREACPETWEPKPLAAPRALWLLVGLAAAGRAVPRQPWEPTPPGMARPDHDTRHHGLPPDSQHTCLVPGGTGSGLQGGGRGIVILALRSPLRMESGGEDPSPQTTKSSKPLNRNHVSSAPST